MIQEELQPDVREVVGFGGVEIRKKNLRDPWNIPQNTSLYYIDIQMAVLCRLNFWESDV